MNDMGVFLIAGYAPIGVAAEPESENFFDNLDEGIATKSI